MIISIHAGKDIFLACMFFVRSNLVGHIQVVYSLASRDIGKVNKYGIMPKMIGSILYKYQI